MDLISVIVPIYNIAEYLPRSITSIIQQTYENLEIIAVDDGSTDVSGEVLRSLQLTDQRIRIIHQENGGVLKARVAGVKAANGDWIGFVDGDDYIEPDMYERLLKNAKQYDADISHCGYQMVFPSRVDYYYNTGKVVFQDSEKGLQDLFEGVFVEPGLWNKLFKKSLFRSMLEDESMDYNIRNLEDLLMNFYLFREARCSIYEDFCPYHYILRKGSAVTASVNEHNLKDPLVVLQRIRQETEESPALQKMIDRSIVKYLIALISKPLGKQKSLIKSYRDKARKILWKLLPEILKADNGLKIKIEALTVVVWPGAYRTFHYIYSTIRGTRNKYEVK